MFLFEESVKAKYYVNRNGEVYSSINGIIKKKKATLHSRGYMYVRTAKKNYQLHRIVACAFIERIEGKDFVNHKDGNKQNNDVSNLEWVTHKENIEHAIRTGLTNLMIKNEGCLKYTNEQCKDVISMVKSGMKYISAGEKYGMPYSTVAHLIRGSRRNII